jgi:hypothetical protein
MSDRPSVVSHSTFQTGFKPREQPSMASHERRLTMEMAVTTRGNLGGEGIPKFKKEFLEQTAIRRFGRVSWHDQIIQIFFLFRQYWSTIQIILSVRL